MNRLRSAINSKQSFAFLSSLCKEFIPFGTRSNIYRLNFDPIEKGLPIYVDEYYSRENNNIHSDERDPFTSIDRLIEYVSKCDLLIILFVNNKREYDHGSIIKPRIDTVTYVSAASYWEIEIFQAALLKKPVFILAEDGFIPGKYLSQVLEFFQSIIPNKIQYYPVNEMVDVVKYILMHKKYPINLSTNQLSINKYLRRIDLIRIQNLHNSNSLFIQNLSSIPSFYTGKAELDFIREGLKSYSAIESHEQKLTRLYPIYKELLKADYRNPKNKEYLTHWNDFSSAWSSNAAWYGLHGRISMGVYHHLVDTKNIREIIKATSIKVDKAETNSPLGGLASELYSIFGLTKNRKELKLALQVISSMQKPLGRGTISIRGHCHFRLGNYFSAKKDFQGVLRSVEEDPNTKPELLAEAISQLGSTYFFTFQCFKGMNYLKKAVNISVADNGQKIRTIRRLALAYKRIGAKTKSKELFDEASRIAEKLGANDQIRKILEER